MRLLRPLVVLPDFLPGPILLLGSFLVGVPVPIFLPGIIWAGNRDLGLAGRPQARCWWGSLSAPSGTVWQGIVWYCRVEYTDAVGMDRIILGHQCRAWQSGDQ